MFLYTLKELLLHALNLKKKPVQFLGPKKGGVSLYMECATKNSDELCYIVLQPM